MMQIPNLSKNQSYLIVTELICQVLNLSDTNLIRSWTCQIPNLLDTQTCLIMNITDTGHIKGWSYQILNFLLSPWWGTYCIYPRQNHHSAEFLQVIWRQEQEENSGVGLICLRMSYEEWTVIKGWGVWLVCNNFVASFVTGCGRRLGVGGHLRIWGGRGTLG
jgi:hypothetical protein